MAIEKEKLRAFLADLTALSRKHGIWLDGAEVDITPGTREGERYICDEHGHDVHATTLVPAYGGPWIDPDQ